MSKTLEDSIKAIVKHHEKKNGVKITKVVFEVVKPLGYTNPEIKVTVTK